MREFPLCGFCQKEYTDPSNRRFHAQTVACPTCGPKAYLTDNQGEPIQADDPVRAAGKLLSEGKILAIKGYGGFHIAASTMLEAPLLRLRETKHRREKTLRLWLKLGGGRGLLRYQRKRTGTADFAPEADRRVK
jgi:hydrogenase maturation protein HypF